MTAEITPDTVPLVRDDSFRVALTASCSDCDAIPKVAGAGQLLVQGGRSVQVMHNGLSMLAGGYYGDWMTEVIRRLQGHHEPQEERVFHEILKHVGPKARMIELGCFWAYYSLWFLKDQPGRAALGVEPDPAHIAVGRANAALNGGNLTIRQGFLGAEDRDAAPFATEASGVVTIPMIRASTLCRTWAGGHADILHCDAQGAETLVISDCEPLLRAGHIRFLIVSTHAETITGDALTHQRCLAMIEAFGGRVLEEHDVHESFSGDGLIAAYFGREPLDWPALGLSYNRYSSSLFRNPLYDVAGLRGTVAKLTDALSAQASAAATAAGPQAMIPPARVAHVYRTLLERDPEPGLGLVASDPVDFCLSVALSPEREALLRRRQAKATETAHGLAISPSGFGGHWVTAMADKVIGQSLREGGAFNEGDVGRVMQFLGGLGTPLRGDCFLEIGSNIGTHSIYALHNGFASAICAEPDSTNFRLLRVNQILNGVDDRCRNFNIAVSDRDGSAAFELSPQNFGDHRVRVAGQDSGAGALHDEAGRRTVTVRVMCLATLLAQPGVDLARIGLAWVDTRGHEGHILHGAAPLFSAGVPVVAEFWPYGLHRAGGYAMLRGALAGRRIYDLRAAEAGGGPVAVGLDQLDAIYADFLRREDGAHSPHTDLLII